MTDTAGATARQGAIAPLLWALCLPALLLACSPALDWREARPEGSGATMMFPCRPASHERTAQLGGARVAMRQHACSAAGATFSLIVTEAGSPEAVTPLLAALRAQAIANVAGQATALLSPAYRGTTPNVESARLRIDGKLPDGRPVVEHAAFFVRGTRLYQATVIGTGKALDGEALESFFGAIHLR